ncbi:hypothetical protein DXG01_011601, partial [Tephrocybe rancida]
DDNDKTDNDLESQDDEDMGFSSSIQPLQAVEEQEQTPLQVRRINLAELNRSVARHRPTTTAVSTPHDKDQNHGSPPRDTRPGSDSEDDDINQQICDAFNCKANSPDPAAADNSDLADNDTNQAGALLIPLLARDVKLNSAPTINDFANPIVRGLLLTGIRKYEGHVVGR